VSNNDSQQIQYVSALRQRSLSIGLAMLMIIVVCGSVLILLWADPEVKSASSQSAGKGNRETELLLAQARLASGKGDFERSLEYVEQAIQSGADGIDPHVLKAELLFRLHRSDEMIPSLRFVLSVEPDHFESHANLAYALQFSGELDEAEVEARWCLQQQPDFTAARRILAEIQRDRGDADAALAELEIALGHSPQDLDSRLLHADLLMYHREFEAAYESLMTLDARLRNNHRVVAALIRACQFTQRESLAEQYRQQLYPSGSSEVGRQ